MFEKHTGVPMIRFCLFVVIVAGIYLHSPERRGPAVDPALADWIDGTRGKVLTAVAVAGAGEILAREPLRRTIGAEVQAPEGHLRDPRTRTQTRQHP